MYNALTAEDKINWETIILSICKRENRMDIWDDEDDLPTIVDRLIDECDVRIKRQ